MIFIVISTKISRIILFGIMVDILELFSVPVLCVKLDLDVSSIEKFCLDYQDKNKGRHLSNETGYQVAFPVDTEQTKLLVDEITKHAITFGKLHSLNIDPVIDQIWMNINGFKDYNLVHNHPMSIFSGVYYIKAPEKCGNIKFEHPGVDVLSFAHCGFNFTQWNKFNSSIHWLKAGENILYIFPSLLKHRVEPNLSYENRISMSFNTSSKSK